MNDRTDARPRLSGVSAAPPSRRHTPTRRDRRPAAPREKHARDMITARASPRCHRARASRGASGGDERLRRRFDPLARARGFSRVSPPRARARASRAASYASPRASSTDAGERDRRRAREVVCYWDADNLTPPGGLEARVTLALDARAVLARLTSSTF